NNPLLKPVKQKGTVGIIPYYQIKGKTYVFLGQELPGGKKEAAATFSDFGGSMNPDGKTVLAHALREFKEETMRQIHLSDDDVLKNGYLLYKKTDKGRGIYYIFVKFSEKQYNKANKIHVAKVRLKASSAPNSHLEKESFAWMSLDDLMQQAVPAPVAKPEDTSAQEPITPVVTEQQRFAVHTPDGETMSILVRGYFLQDCLQHPDMPALVKQLK
ncbi:MAG TPA: NUDIX hydrolase, partial [Gammaproteobacteria bacterium]|nr:NUDIX hydrolase [Gammaproteobacteria bacterium]